MAFKLNTRLLIKTLSLQSIKGDDEDLRNFIKTEISKIKDTTLKEDSYGNFLVTKGKSELYPCVVSHYDTVHKRYPDKRIKQEQDLLYAFSYSQMSQVGIGGDDLVGVALCLQFIQELKAVKAVFFRDEEVGCLGAKAVNLDFFKDCKAVIEIDRKGYEDLSISMAGVDVNSDDFLKACEKPMKEHGFKKLATSVTDVYTLKLRGLDISVTNVSCGYFNPHSNEETICITDTNRCYCLVNDIICNLKNQRYVHIYTPPVYVPVARVSQYYRDSPFTYFLLDLDTKQYPGYFFLRKSNMPSVIVSENVNFDTESRTFWHKTEKRYYIPSEIYKDNDPKDIRRLAAYFRILKINDHGVEFVYSYVMDKWLPKSTAVEYLVDGQFHSYISKQTNDAWERGY